MDTKLVTAGVVASSATALACLAFFSGFNKRISTVIILYLHCIGLVDQTNDRVKKAEEKLEVVKKEIAHEKQKCEEQRFLFNYIIAAARINKLVGLGEHELKGSYGITSTRPIQYDIFFFTVCISHSTARCLQRRD